MCTAVYYKNRYFGRNLDYERSFGEEVMTMPRGFSYPLGEGELQTKYAVLGMAHEAKGVPLFYDGMNEKGLAMAGLLFEGNAVYQKPMAEKDNMPVVRDSQGNIMYLHNVGFSDNMLPNSNTKTIYRFQSY